MLKVGKVIASVIGNFKRYPPIGGLRVPVDSKINMYGEQSLGMTFLDSWFKTKMITGVCLISSRCFAATE